MTQSVGCPAGGGTVGRVLAAAARILVDAFAPTRCAGCDRVAPAWVCDTCAGAVCAVPPPPVRQLAGGALAAAAFDFGGPVRAALHRGKYRAAQEALRALARLSAPRLTMALAPPDALVAIPLGPRRRRSRGYNQAEIIVAELASVLRRPLAGGLARIRDTAPQTARDEDARRRNVAGSFAWQGGSLEGRALWLVDDVLTTGATAAAATLALADAGARRVDVAVIAAVR